MTTELCGPTQRLPSLAEVLFEAFETHGARVCLRLPSGAVWHYHEMHRLARGIGAELLRRGASPGDRILVQLDKTPEAVCIYLGCLYAGLIYVPLNSAYTESELRDFVQDADPALVIRDARCRLPPEVACLLREELVAAGRSGVGLPRPRSGAAEDPAALLYTSGTTGRAKGALLTNRNLVSNAQGLRSVWDWQDEDVLLHGLPIYHVHGLFVALHCAFFSGSEVRFLPRFTVADVISALPVSSVVMGVPTHYSRLLEAEAFHFEACRGLRLLISGSAPMVPQLHALVEERTGHRVVERYGLTEGMILTSNPIEGARVPGTVGFALPGVTLRVAENEGADARAKVRIGEVEASGPGIFAGYFRNAQATAKAMTGDGFLRTGDLGSLDAQGRLTISGRSRDLIISGGLNVYPKEIEMLIDEMPQVHESAVIGVPHPDFGEAVVAVVCGARELSLEQLREFLGARLARFKLPKKLVRLDDLPRNPMGKVQKAGLREQYRHLFASRGGSAV